MSLSYIYLALILWISSINYGRAQNVVVDTELGALKGYTVDVKGHNYNGNDVFNLDMFLGIPYAEPPVGQLRFARTVPKTHWRPKTRDALAFSPACQQPKWYLEKYSFSHDYITVDEDCLYLNVYAPHPTSHVPAPLPVMVWIHGGSYTYGSGAEYDGRILALEGVVVVTINYRLGIFGFLSTDDDAAPGNYGLMDQLMALEWVKSNIHHFNGDPNRVTLFGQGAGGGSVSLHMFSKRAQGLFQAAIAQSGCALSPWAIYRPPHKPMTYATELAQSVRCDTSSSTAMVACLRSQWPAALLQKNVSAPPMISTFAPTVDNYYITDLPEVLLEKGNYLRDVRVMTGFVPQEYSEDLENVTNIDNGLSGQQLENILHAKSRRYIYRADFMFNSLKCMYPPSKDFQQNRKYAIAMNSDYGYVAPHIKMSTELGLRGTKVWLYDFMYMSKQSRKKAWIGVTHADELYYIFGAPFLRRMPCPGTRAVTCPSVDTWGHIQPWYGDDLEMSYATMKLWADFARLGNDTDTFYEKELVSDWPSIDWPQYDQHQTILYMKHPAEIKHMFKTQGLQFWESFNYLNLSQPIPYLCDQTVFVG